jgi:glycosyltransferase involved in cell wall biosynthesis
MKILCLSPGAKFQNQIMTVDYLTIPDDIYRFLSSAKSIDELFKANDKQYLEFINKINDLSYDYDFIYSDQTICIHPELVLKKFSHVKMILNAIDDPIVTYSKTIPFGWAYDAITYVSPSYNTNFSMFEILNTATAKPLIWLPHSRILNLISQEATSKAYVSKLSDRTFNSIYVGAYYENKADRLSYVKSQLKSDFQIFGNWNYFGYRGYLRCLQGKPVIKQRVTGISMDEYQNIALKSKISINMHYFENGEVGNQRTYHAIALGCLLLTNRGSRSEFEIFNDNEVLYYDNFKDIPTLILDVLNNEEHYETIRINGLNKLNSEYSVEKYYQRMYDEFKSI